jgi:hypothetical protein
MIYAKAKTVQDGDAITAGKSYPVWNDDGKTFTIMDDNTEPRLMLWAAKGYGWERKTTEETGQ